MEDILKAVELTDDKFELNIVVEDLTTLEDELVIIDKHNHQQVTNFLRRLADKIDSKYIEIAKGD